MPGRVKMTEAVAAALTDLAQYTLVVAFIK